MTAPKGAITTVEQMREVLGRGVRTLYLAPAYSYRDVLKFTVLDARVSKPNGYWIINRAYDNSRGYKFDTGIVISCEGKPSDRWHWYENYWLAYAAQLRMKHELERDE